MSVSIRDYTLINVVQVSHHQGDVRYGASRSIQCSCMSLISVSWTLFKSPGLWNKFNLDYILDKRDQLFKLIGKFRYLGVEDLAQKFMIENCLINVELLENKTGEITAGAYLLSITEIVNSAQQIGTGALLIVNNYILGLIWGTDSIYLLDSHSKDGHGNLSSSGTAVLLRFGSLKSLENYIGFIYYNTFPQTLYFQVQFINIHCSANTKTAIKCALKKEQLSARREIDLDTKKRKYYNDPQKKRDAAKEIYNNKKESIKQSIKKANIWKIMHQKAKYQENPEMQQAYKKFRY